jgi:hypothetical protein
MVQLTVHVGSDRTSAKLEPMNARDDYKPIFDGSSSWSTPHLTEAMQF